MVPNANRRLAEREVERQRNDSGRRSAWAFLWTLFAFKIVTVGVIWFAATSTHSDELPLIVATTWYWFLIPLAAISGPLLYRWRLVKLRRRRDQLRVAEWMDRPQGETSAAPKLTVRDILLKHERKSA